MLLDVPLQFLTQHDRILPERLNPLIHGHILRSSRDSMALEGVHSVGELECCNFICVKENGLLATTAPSFLGRILARHFPLLYAPWATLARLFLFFSVQIATGRWQ